MPFLPLGVDRHHREASRRQQLLAVHGVRGDLERRPPACRAARIEPMAMSRAELMRQLEELIEAIDRRLPHVERAGEAAIAGEAALLRRLAMQRLTELAQESHDDAPEPPRPPDSTAQPR
jgi:hypothetical protein